MARSTRESILVAAAELLRRRGYAGVGMKDIAAASGAPIGSLYHHFRGGKEQIAREALIAAGAAYGLLLPTIVDGHRDLGEAIAAIFAQAADDIEQTGWATMCPVATVAAEVADAVEDIRQAAAGIFDSWIDDGARYLVTRGLGEDAARDVTMTIVVALEGAFLVARVQRSGEPLRAAGRVLAPPHRGVTLGAPLSGGYSEKQAR
jgi:AcrR family transcriptional regulator